MREEFERQHPELAKVRAEYAGWLVGFLDVDPATGTAEGVRIEDPAGGAEVRWKAGRRYIVRQVPEAGGAWCLCRDAAVWWRDAPVPEALLMTSPARFAGTEPEPAVPVWAPGTDGVGPALLSPDGGPVRWPVAGSARAWKTRGSGAGGVFIGAGLPSGELDRIGVQVPPWPLTPGGAASDCGDTNQPALSPPRGSPPAWRRTYTP